jgi:large subunit ribosomal protein L6
LRLKNEELEFSLGASHPIKIVIPNGLEVDCSKMNEITIKGISKEKVGQFAAQIRNLRKNSPYKLNGVYYKNEKINLKKKSSKTS